MVHDYFSDYFLYFYNLFFRVKFIDRGLLSKYLTIIVVGDLAYFNFRHYQGQYQSNKVSPKFLFISLCERCYYIFQEKFCLC